MLPFSPSFESMFFRNNFILKQINDNCNWNQTVKKSNKQQEQRLLKEARKNGWILTALQNPIPEDLIKKYQDEIDWRTLIVSYQVFSNEFIKENIEKITDTIKEVENNKKLGNPHKIRNNIFIGIPKTQSNFIQKIENVDKETLKLIINKFDKKEINYLDNLFRSFFDSQKNENILSDLIKEGDNTILEKLIKRKLFGKINYLAARDEELAKIIFEITKTKDIISCDQVINWKFDKETILNNKEYLLKEEILENKNITIDKELADELIPKLEMLSYKKIGFLTINCLLTTEAAERFFQKYIYEVPTRKGRDKISRHITEFIRKVIGNCSNGEYVIDKHFKIMEDQLRKENWKKILFSPKKMSFSFVKKYEKYLSCPVSLVEKIDQKPIEKSFFKWLLQPKAKNENQLYLYYNDICYKLEKRNEFYIQRKTFQNFFEASNEKQKIIENLKHRNKLIVVNQDILTNSQKENPTLPVRFIEKHIDYFRDLIESKDVKITTSILHFRKLPSRIINKYNIKPNTKNFWLYADEKTKEQAIKKERPNTIIHSDKHGKFIYAYKRVEKVKDNIYRSCFFNLYYKIGEKARPESNICDYTGRDSVGINFSLTNEIIKDQGDSEITLKVYLKNLAAIINSKLAAEAIPIDGRKVEEVEKREELLEEPF